jgi:hypothetical protein
MEINWLKYHVHYSFTQEDLTHLLENVLPFPRNILEEGFKYLGFHLKSNAYSFEDWVWLFKKFKDRISLWVNMWF